MTENYIWWWCSCFGALESVKLSLLMLFLRLLRNEVVVPVHIFGWSKPIWKLFVLDGNTWYNISSLSCHTIYMDIPEPFSLLFSIVHCFRYVFKATSRICTELLYVDSSWKSCLCSSTWRSPQEYVTYELVPTSPGMSCMSGLSNFDSFRDGW